MILIVTGSPNRSGNTNQIVHQLTKDLNKSYLIYDTYQNKVKPCVDCGYCTKKSGCSLKDDMTDVYQLIDEGKVDTIVIASPLYFATFSGPMVEFISRFQTYYNKKFVRKELDLKIPKAVLIVTAGGKWPSMFVGVKESFKILKLLFQVEEVKELLVNQCDDINVLEHAVVKEEIESIKELIEKR